MYRYIYIYIYLYTHIHTHTRVCMYIYIYIHIHIRILLHHNMYFSLSLYIYIYIYICICIYIYIHKQALKLRCAPTCSGGAADRPECSAKLKWWYIMKAGVKWFIQRIFIDIYCITCIYVHQIHISTGLRQARLT